MEKQLLNKDTDNSVAHPCGLKLSMYIFLSAYTTKINITALLTDQSMEHS